MARGADLFIVCKNCGSEVSPYVTECPYCGQRVRKRAPKIERGGAAPAREPRRAGRGRRARSTAPRGPRLGRLRPGEIPGLRADGLTRPWGTIALVTACFGIYLLATAGAIGTFDVVVLGPIGSDWWRPLTSPFVHFSGGMSIFAGGAYQMATMVAVGIYGWLLERRHGAWVVILLYLLAGAGGMLAASALEPAGLSIGANGLALGLLAAWAMPDLLAWRRDDDWEGDLLGTAVIAAVLLLMPLAVRQASAVAGLTGVVAGVVVGYPLARASGR
ncbi:MAG TPA: rhomboid family intramembrane serine protease [Solirubrobacteraceae bacterium]|jgi:membrane associated rhomboid family serine protease